MLKRRVLPIVLLAGHNVVKSIQFSTYRTLGNPITICRIYESRGVDEIVLLDIKATAQGRGPNLELIHDIASECFMPVSVGGGVSNIEEVRKVLRAGADKVIINSAAIANPQLVKDISIEFGSQCCVVSIDVKLTKNGRYEVFVNGGQQPTDLDPANWARKAEMLGAGEILLSSIDRDGMMQGYDLDLIKKVAESVTIPVVVSGGAGIPEHFSQAFLESNASALAAASIFHFTSCTPLDVKRHLASHHIPVRL
jgi:cyclase